MACVNSMKLIVDIMKHIFLSIIFAISFLGIFTTHGVAETLVQKQFIKESLVLSSAKGYKLLTELPSSTLEKVPPTKNVKLMNNSWAEKADLFSIKWNVTYKVFDGYLLIGSQYVPLDIARSSTSLGSFGMAASADQINFLKNLSSEQLKSLRTTQKVMLSQFSSTQINQLNGILNDLNQSDRKISNNTTGYVEAFNVPALYVFSNGRVAGVLTTAHDSKSGFDLVTLLDLKNLITDPKNNRSLKTNENKAQKKMSQVRHFQTLNLTLPDFLRQAVQGSSAKSELVINSDLNISNRLIYLNHRDIPADVVNEFIDFSLDLNIRQIENLIYVSYAKTLPAKSVVQDSIRYLQNFMKSAKKPLNAATFRSEAGERLWQAAPVVSTSARPIYQVELSEASLEKLANLDPKLKSLMKTAPKVAFGMPTILSFYIRHPNKQIAVALVVIPHQIAWPLDELAFQTLTKEASK